MDWRAVNEYLSYSNCVLRICSFSVNLFDVLAFLVWFVENQGGFEMHNIDIDCIRAIINAMYKHMRGIRAKIAGCSTKPRLGLKLIFCGLMITDCRESKTTAPQTIIAKQKPPMNPCLAGNQRMPTTMRTGYPAPTPAPNIIPKVIMHNGNAKFPPLIL